MSTLEDVYLLLSLTNDTWSDFATQNIRPEQHERPMENQSEEKSITKRKALGSNLEGSAKNAKKIQVSRL